MNILLLAPQPFYQDRGTPIAVDLVLKALAERGEYVDVVTYHEGSAVRYDHVTVWRIPRLPFIRNIRPGFSWKKLVCDAFMCCTSLRLVLTKRYQLVHAVEESVFIALGLKWLFNIPYVYDMDSSLVQQTIEKYPLLTPFAALLGVFERLAVRNAEVVIPVCDALAAAVETYKPKKVVVLQDPSLLQDVACPSQLALKAELGIQGLCAMYVGNLEAYQGIALLLESFALVLQKTASVDLVIIGGEAADISTYQGKSRQLQIHHRVHFLGPQPVARLAAYLAQADILVSPRIKGQNTPMKLYSYLHSGKPILATALPTHTQILHSQVAMLTAPSPEAFAHGWLSLIADSTHRAALGAAGKRLAEEQYSYAAFRDKLNSLFDGLHTVHRLQHGPTSRRITSDPK
jgi:glycosyltransferase involved in cell wall biosynthesis